MILDPSTKAECVLAGAVSANQPEVHVEYQDYNPQGEQTKPALFRVALNSTSDVTILAAPSQGFIREVLRVSIYNKDTASVTLTVKTDDGTTERIVCKTTLLTLEVLHYEQGAGWYGVDTNGNRKQVTSSVFSSLTVTGLVDISGASAGQIKFPATQNPSANANTLDDYEEGTWTPTDASGAALTFASPVGTYEKIGRQITTRASLIYPATADGSANVIGSLPFSIANAQDARQGVLTGATAATAKYNIGAANAASTVIRDATTVALTNAALSGATIFISNFYY